MSDVDIVKRYNAVVRGISNYYSLSTRQGVLYELFYSLRRSCALTLAHKHKKKYAKWALDKYGEDLRIEVDGSKEPIGFYLPSISKDVYGPK
jgi:Type II intron maturase